MKTTFCFFLFVSFALISFSQSGLPVKKLTIFKNSTSMVTKEGQIKSNDKKISYPVPLQALWGTYWLGGSKDNSVKSVWFKYDTLKSSKKIKNLPQLLSSNIGKQVSLSLFPVEKTDKQIQGKIADYLSEFNLLKIKQDNGKITFIKTENINIIDFADDNNGLYKDDSLVMMATVITEKNDNIYLQENYMQLGVNWIPSYFLKIINDKEARIEMKATIENEAEDFKDVETEVVVGAPQLYFGNKLDPITNSRITQPSTNSGYINSRFDNNDLSNAFYAQVQTTTGRTTGGGDMTTFNTNYDTEGEKNNDLFYYNLGKISLDKNSKGNFPIFSTTVNYKDIYEANIPDRINFSSSQYCDNSENRYDVFHSIEIKNSTVYPFTTASLMVITEKNQFLAQDLLKYTPISASSNIKLSKAIDVILKNNEEEVTRVDNFKKIAKTTYSKATLKGTVTVENLQKKNITVNLTKNLLGIVNNQTGGNVKKQKTYGSVNPNSEIKWEVQLNAGEKKTFQYDYDVLYIPYGY